MRFLVKATIPVEAGNDLVRDPSFGDRLHQVLADIEPEAAYFTAQDGQRTIYLVVQHGRRPRAATGRGAAVAGPGSRR